MREFKIQDPFGLKEMDIVEVNDFFVLPEENIAIRRNDFFENGEDDIFYDRKFPVFSAVAPSAYTDYVNKGEYSPAKANTLKFILNGKMQFILQDKVKSTGFFFDTTLNPIMRPFAVELLSSAWDLSAIRKRLDSCKGVTKLLVSDYSAAEELQKLTFLYKPRSDSEFTTIYYKCLQAGLAGYPVMAHIIDELDLAYYQRKEN